jgi:hypothetical protein
MVPTERLPASIFRGDQFPWRQPWRQTLHGAAQRSADGGVFGADEDLGGSA